MKANDRPLSIDDAIAAYARHDLYVGAVSAELAAVILRLERERGRGTGGGSARQAAGGRARGNEEATMNVIGFDWHGTLVDSWTATPLPGVREKLHTLPAGTRTFIATNQSGPVFRAMLGDAKYPTAGEVAARIVSGLAALGWLPDLLLICTHPGRSDDAWQVQAELVASALHAVLRPCLVEALPAWRKPAPGMLLYAAAHFGAAIDYYIGDMETDHQAAIIAGCRYLDAAVWREKGL